MATSYDIKKILDDIIIYTYKDEVSEKRLKYMLVYSIVLNNKVLRSKHGHYRYSKKEITIFNLYRTETQLVCTSIHELAHHIDRVFRNTSDHSKNFYAVFKRLLFTGLDMGLFAKEDALDMKTDAADSNKIKAMLEEYIPNPIPYMQEKKRIVVKNCFSIKDKLKEQGFRYNLISCTWEKLITVAEVEEFENKLNELSCEYEIIDASSMNFEAVGTLIAVGNCYDHRDNLKKHGFVWNTRDKRWQKRIKMTDYDEILKKLRCTFCESISFKLVKQKS